MKKDQRHLRRNWRARNDRFNSQPVLPTEHSWKDLIAASYIPKVKCRRLQLTEPRAKLEEDVWSKGFPDDVFCSILAWLPMSSFFRLKCVCRKWSLMAQDPNFLDTCARVPSREASLFLKGSDGLLWLYEPAVKAWKCVPKSFFHPKVTEGTCSLLTAAGGRVLYLRSSPQYSLMVYNPLNQTQRTLPPMFDMTDNFDLPTATEIHVVGMYEERKKNYYQILVVDKRTNSIGYDSSDSDDSDDPEPIASQVYDSRTFTWTMMGRFEPLDQLRILNGALFGDSLHCLTITQQQSASYYRPYEVDELAVYKIRYSSWELETLKVPTQDQSLVAPHMFSTRGRHMLVAAVALKETRNLSFPEWKSIILWRLEMVDNLEDKWMKMMEIDLRGLNAGLFKVTSDNFVFLSDGDVVYFGSNTGSTLGMINVHTFSWLLLPSFPGLTPSTGQLPPQRYQTFLYDPRFDLVA